MFSRSIGGFHRFEYSIQLLMNIIFGSRCFSGGVRGGSVLSEYFHYGFIIGSGAQEGFHRRESKA